MSSTNLLRTQQTSEMREQFSVQLPALNEHSAVVEQIPRYPLLDRHGACEAR